MAPGPKLSSNSPMGKDIKRIVREMIHEELSLVIKKRGNSKVVISMTLHGDPIGEPISIEADLTWYRDHGHGGGDFADGVRLDVK